MALRALAAAAALGAIAAPAGWIVTDRLEQRNDFCNACHLEPEVPLHVAIRRDFDGRPAESLAAAHAAAGNERRDDDGFRCIDCHGGVGAIGRARVKLLAAKDAFWYVVRRFEEPTHMRWPLHDEDCAQCHEDFDTTPPAAWEAPRFHQLPVHNVELRVGCVECHLAHDEGGNSQAWFLHATLVRSQCARCHPEFEEGGE